MQLRTFSSFLLHDCYSNSEPQDILPCLRKTLQLFHQERARAAIRVGRRDGPLHGHTNLRLWMYFPFHRDGRLYEAQACS